MNPFKNLKITAKIVLFVLSLQFATMAVFTYVENQSEEKIVRKNIDDSIKIVAYAVNDFVLRDYHDKIVDKDSISEDEYMDLLVKLSAFADKVSVQYISSLIKRGDDILYTSTSATKEDFETNRYELFFDKYEDATQELYDGYSNQEIFYEETLSKYGFLRTISIPFTNKYGEVYMVAIDIEVNHLAVMYEKNRNRSIIMAAIIFFISSIVSILMIKKLLHRIVLIRNALQDFFDYLNRKTSSIVPIKISGGDELGEMGRLINDNIQVISSNIEQDNELIDEIASISAEVQSGSFSSRINIEADNPALNNVKDNMNEIFSNMQVVMLDILRVLKEFSKLNYSAKLDDYNLDGEMGKLLVELNVYCKNTSEYMLNKAYDSINLDKDSSFLNEYIEDLTEKLYKHIKELNELKQNFEDIKRINRKNFDALNAIEKEKEYVDGLLISLKLKVQSVCSADTQLQNREKLETSLAIDEIIDDISQSMSVVSTNRADIDTYLNQTIKLMDSLSKSFDFYESRIIEMKKSVDNTQKISTNLKDLSSRMRTYIDQSDFPGKDSINILINNTDR